MALNNRLTFPEVYVGLLEDALKYGPANGVTIDEEGTAILRHHEGEYDLCMG